MAASNHEADVAFIEALAKLLRENDLTELEVKREYGEADRLNVRVSRGQKLPCRPRASPAAAPSAPARRNGAAAPSGRSGRTCPGALTSPMVGTAYLSPEPGADPFVKIGDHVGRGPDAC